MHIDAYVCTYMYTHPHPHPHTKILELGGLRCASYIGVPFVFANYKNINEAAKISSYLC